tara:strand:+ start:210 stop:371 length:162 start_codon:yes stop_codon:yes gene_type:complete
MELMKQTPILHKAVMNMLLWNSGIPDEDTAMALAHDEHPHAPFVLPNELKIDG